MFVKSKNNLEVEIVDNDDKFLQLRNNWDELAQDATSKFEWSYKWWKNFKDDNYKLNIAVIKDNNEVIGIAPLFIQTVRALKLLSLKKVYFLGDDISDYLGFLVKPGKNKELIFQSLYKYIYKNLEFDCLDLCQINSFHPDFYLWQTHQNLLDYKLKPAMKNHKIKLSEYANYDEYNKSLRKNMRNNLRNIYNRLKNDNLGIEFVIKNEVSQEEFEAISKIHIERNKYLYNKGNHKRDSYFAYKKYKSFLKDYFCSDNLKSSDSKLIMLMKCKDKIIAYGLAIIGKSTLYYFNMGFDLTYERYSPSIIIINELIKYAFNNNLEYMDFMRGDDSYKHQWINVTFQNYNLVKEKTLKAKMVYIYRNYFSNTFINKLRKNKNKKEALLNS